MMGGGEAKKRKTTKRALCRHWARDGTCRMGVTCGFAHGEEQLGQSASVGSESAWPASASMWEPSSMQMMQMQQMQQMWNMQGMNMNMMSVGDFFRSWQQPAQVKVPTTKKKLCRHFARDGHCALGAKCGFAHGEEEIGARVPEGGVEAAAAEMWQMQMQKKGKGKGMMGMTGKGMMGGMMGGGMMGMGGMKGCGGFDGGMMGCGGFDGGMQKGKGGLVKVPTKQEKELYNFKTTLCKNFANVGTCSQGEGCPYAHGEEELMQPGEAKKVMEEMAQDGTVDFQM